MHNLAWHGCDLHCYEPPAVSGDIAPRWWSSKACPAACGAWPSAPARRLAWDMSHVRNWDVISWQWKFCNSSTLKSRCMRAYHMKQWTHDAVNGVMVARALGMGSVAWSWPLSPSCECRGRLRRGCSGSTPRLFFRASPPISSTGINGNFREKRSSCCKHNGTNNAHIRRWCQQAGKAEDVNWFHRAYSFHSACMDLYLWDVSRLMQCWFHISAFCFFFIELFEQIEVLDASLKCLWQHDSNPDSQRGKEGLLVLSLGIMGNAPQHPACTLCRGCSEGKRSEWTP